MSTIEPSGKPTPPAGRRRAAIWLALAALANTATGVALGLGLGSLADKVRDMTVNSFFAWSDISPYYWLLFVGLIAGFLTGPWYASARRQFAGSVRIVVPSIALKSAGAAIGIWLSSLSWHAPLKVGYLLDPAFGDQTPWSSLAWVAYSMTWWLPVIFVLLALLAVGLTYRSDAKRMAAERLAEQLYTTGRRCAGKVSSVQSTGEQVNHQPVIEFAVAYTDADGTKRWVTKRSPFPPDQPPKSGDRATVFYDPQRPDDPDRVLVILGNPDE